MRTTLWMEDDCRDAGGRATQGAVAEVEPRREQRSRTCESGLPWRSDVGIKAVLRITRLGPFFHVTTHENQNNNATR